MSKDFTPFLKYIPDALPGWLPPVGEGWHTIVHNLLCEIDKVVSEHVVLVFAVVQIKEKFGDLRIYYRVDQSVSDDVRQQISKAVNRHATRARSTCEICGAPGRIGSYFTGYYRALCRPHAIIHLRSDTPKLPIGKSWNIQLADSGWKIINSSGELLNQIELEKIELLLTDLPEGNSELRSFRDARYLAGI